MLDFFFMSSYLEDADRAMCSRNGQLCEVFFEDAQCSARFEPPIRPVVAVLFSIGNTKKLAGFTELWGKCTHTLKAWEKLSATLSIGKPTASIVDGAYVIPI